jgi:tetratricopeptide (TPR) repeat protein
MPDLRAHDFGTGEPPREILAAFAEGSRSVLGRTPLLTRGGHLLALGLLHERLGDPGRAEADLRAAQRERGTALELAERRFHLGRLLTAAGEEEEGERLLAAAAERPEFVPAASALRARLAESRGDLPGALTHLQALCRARPDDVLAALEFGRVAIAAGELARARVSLGGARVLSPQDARVHAGRVELALAEKDRSAAAAALEDYERAGGDPGWAAAQRRRLRESE